MSDTSFQPDWASPPGETINRLLDRANLSTGQFADQLGVTINEAMSFISGIEPMSPDMAVRISKIFGGAPAYWLKREEQFRNDIAVMPLERRYAPSWVNSLPYADMAKMGWVPTVRSESEKAEQLLHFFGISAHTQWHLKYSSAFVGSAFRASYAFDTRYESVSAWLRQGEIAARAIECATWNRDALKERLPELRALTKNKYPEKFIPQLRALCAQCGVALVIARTPPGCFASGATQFLSKKKAMLLLSFRYKSDDHFWFSFFHEVGHLVLHDLDELFIDDDFSAEDSEEEKEANAFSQCTLIPEKMRSEMLRLPRKTNDVIRFAVRAGVAPGIVVGQMQNAGVLPKEFLNGLKRRYSNEEVQAVSG